MINKLVPRPKEQLVKFRNMLIDRKPFTFVRFSDGETEILFNRYLEISGGKTFFKGNEYKNNYPIYDSKVFNPNENEDLRSDLLEAAFYKDDLYFKGIPTSHNGKISEREFMVRLNGGFDSQLTFADLFLNSNYSNYRNFILPEFSRFEKIYVVANYRAEFKGILEDAVHIDIPDNFFSNYAEVLDSTYNRLVDIETGSLVLSSASTLTKILGYKIFLCRQDVTFIDIGTSINDLLGLDLNTRNYHSNIDGMFNKLVLNFKKGHKIKW